MKKTPLQLVKEKFGSKENLIQEIQNLIKKSDFLIEKFNEEKGMASVSNKKLLKIHNTISLIKDKFGSREALITELLSLKNRIKDNGFKLRLEKWSLPRLFDYYNSTIKKSKDNVKAEKTTEKATKKVTKKAVKKTTKKEAKPETKTKAKTKTTKAKSESKTKE